MEKELMRKREVFHSRVGAFKCGRGEQLTV